MMKGYLFLVVLETETSKRMALAFGEGLLAVISCSEAELSSYSSKDTKAIIQPPPIGLI